MSFLVVAMTDFASILGEVAAAYEDGGLVEQADHIASWQFELYMTLAALEPDVEDVDQSGVNLLPDPESVPFCHSSEALEWFPNNVCLRADGTYWFWAGADDACWCGPYRTLAAASARQHQWRDRKIAEFTSL
jgi:hypothetical protein